MSKILSPEVEHAKGQIRAGEVRNEPDSSLKPEDKAKLKMGLGQAKKQPNAKSVSALQERVAMLEGIVEELVDKL